MSASCRANPALLFLLVLVAYSFTALAQGPADILWLDAEHTQPYVIPQEALSRLDWSAPEKVDLSSLPLTGEQAAHLRARIAKKLQDTSGKAVDRKCAPLPVGDGFGLVDPPPGSQTIADLVSAVDMSFTGRVVRLTPAWNPVVGRPYTRVFLQTDDLLKDARRDLAPSQELSYLLPYGAISFGQVRECLASPEAAYWPKPGDRILFLGWRDAVNPQNLYVRSVFEIRDGKVMPGAHAALRDHSPVPLTNLEKDIRRQPVNED